jgi:glycosyltransferase involved in cell wall biosynthesis
VIVVNYGSPDHCGEILADLQTRYPNVRVVTHAKNRGYGGAIRSGIENPTKELIFYTGGDAQYDPRELRLLVQALRDDVDMVNGYKTYRNDPMNRKIIGWLYHHSVRIAFNLHLKDVDYDFRLMRR